ncbi:hypothetical protein Gorai_004140 [Gossypium raimondii]|uniref:Uncharacterized protein n=1 Tax=Gossypium raimondii TaxID=29730 RepID=A0A7J8QIA1_GOSRA|nr:hypothetical protein [Gossypium raimondii]
MDKRCGSCGIGFVTDMDFNINMNTVLYKLSFQPPSDFTFDRFTPWFRLFYLP